MSVICVWITPRTSGEKYLLYPGQERLALVGESGSGKSMTARALMGLVRKPGLSVRIR